MNERLTSENRDDCVRRVLRLVESMVNADLDDPIRSEDRLQIQAAAFMRRHPDLAPLGAVSALIYVLEHVTTIKGASSSLGLARATFPSFEEVLQPEADLRSVSRWVLAMLDPVAPASTRVALQHEAIHDVGRLNVVILLVGMAGRLVDEIAEDTGSTPDRIIKSIIAAHDSTPSVATT